MGCTICKSQPVAYPRQGGSGRAAMSKTHSISIFYTVAIHRMSIIGLKIRHLFHRIFDKFSIFVL